MNETKTTTTNQTTYLYAVYEKDVSYVLTSINSATPTDIIRRLQNAWSADQTARKAVILSEAMARAEAEATEAREEATHHYKEAHRLTLGADDRAQEHDAYEATDTEATEARETASDIFKVLQSSTLSDRADLVQVAGEAEAVFVTPDVAEYFTKSAKVSATIILYHLKAIDQLTARAEANEEDEEPTAEQIHALAVRKYRRAKIAQYIRKQRGINALDDMHTDYKRASDEDVKAWLASGKATGKEHKYPTRAGYITLEHLEATKTRKAGWYFINRRYTIKACQSIDTTEGETITTPNIYADDLEAWETIQTIRNAEGTNQRDRQYLTAFCSADAVHASEQARQAYTAQHTKRTAHGYRYTGTAKGRSETAMKARRAYAGQAIGLETANAESKYYNRMIDRLTALGIDPKQTKTERTAEELREQEFNRYRYHMEANHGNTRPDTRHRPTEQYFRNLSTTATADSPNAVHWLTASEAQTKAQEATEARTRAYTEPRADGRKRIDNSTNSAQANAYRNAKAYNRKQGRAKAKAIARAKDTAKADRLRTAKANAIRLGVCVQSTPWELWQTWSEAQRKAYLEYLDARTA